MAALPSVNMRHVCFDGSRSLAATADPAEATSILMAPVCRLTFDMSGRPQTAKLAVGCPLDGGVGRLPQWSLKHDRANNRAGGSDVRLR
jgi:hypothetical protein